MVTAALFLFIEHVVSVRPEKKMGRVYAQRIVTCMQNVEWSSINPLEQKHSKAVGLP
jgi:hypothetical protein